MKNTTKKITGLFIATALFSIGMSASAATVKPAKVNAATGSTTYVSEEAEQTVSDDFPAARDISWVSDAGGVFTAYFNQSDGRKIANVAADGNLLNVLTYYNPGHVPARVHHLLSAKYPDMKIKTVLEYEQENAGIPDVSYQATLEDASHWYIVTVSGRDVRVKQVLTKA